MGIHLDTATFTFVVMDISSKIYEIRVSYSCSNVLKDIDIFLNIGLCAHLISTFY